MLQPGRPGSIEDPPANKSGVQDQLAAPPRVGSGGYLKLGEQLEPKHIVDMF